MGFGSTTKAGFNRLRVLLNAALVGSAFAVMAGCTRYAEPEVHLIPEGYIGPVNIIYDQPHGASTRDERGWQVYDVGPNGIHISAFESNFGRVTGHEYFYVSPDGDRRRLKYSGWEFAHRAPDTMFAVWAGSTGNLGLQSEGAGFYKYFVGTAADYDAWTETRRVGDLGRALAEQGIVLD